MKLYPQLFPLTAAVMKTNRALAVILFCGLACHAAPSYGQALNKTQMETKPAALLDHQAGTSPIHDQLAAKPNHPLA